MKIILFLLCFTSAFAQQVAFQSFEVDSAAEPHGGIIAFNTFTQANLRKPVLAAAKGIGGRVIVSAIVEQDGSVSDVKAVNSLRPDCDREAIRVFSLFKAWKPALKNGKAVRQQVTTTVLLKPNAPFIYKNGVQINYYDSEKKVLTDSSELARYKQESPLDSNGFANGDIVVYKGKSGNWKEEYRIPLIRSKSGLQNSAGDPIYMIGYQNGNHLWDGTTIMQEENGKVSNVTYYQNGTPTTPSLSYHPNGVVAQKIEEIDGQIIVTSWHSNGQVNQIRSNTKAAPMTPATPDLVQAHWNSNGQQLVKNGNGRVRYTATIDSKASLLPKTTIVEEGTYENGLQQGIWTGRYEDNSFYYEEQFDKGVFQKGKSCVVGQDTISYDILEKQPEFKGGMQAFGTFLSDRLRYPERAQQARLEGQVILSFIVHTDGRIDEATVVKSLGLGTDEEALRVLNASSGRWQPGYQRGQKVRVKYRMPINFSLR